MCRVLVALLALLMAGCSPQIRFKPGEIPSPTSPTDSSELRDAERLHNALVSKVPLWHNPRAERRVSSILKRLLQATPSSGHWTVVIFDDPTWNAMTTVGNHIYVFRGFLDSVPSDDQVAAVLAHEIAHRLAQHEIESSDEKWGKAMAVLVAVAAGAAVASRPGATDHDVSTVMDSTMKVGSGFTTLRYSRDKEREADLVGLFLMADAGFNPQAAADMWSQQMRMRGQGGSDFFSTHPLHEDRYNFVVQLMPLAQERYELARRTGRGARRGRGTGRSVSPAAEAEALRAEQALQSEDLDRAHEIAQGLVARHPRSASGFNLLGLVHARRGESEPAQKAMRKSLTLDPMNPVLIYNTACVEALAGKRDEALRNLERAFTLQPQLVAAAAEDPDLESLHDDAAFEELLARQYLYPAPMDVGGNTFSVNVR